MQYQAIQLINFVNNKMQITQQGLKRLGQLQGKILPVCITGSILSGKSTIINQIIQKQVFEVGNTTMPKTKGVYVYFQQIVSKLLVEPLHIMYIDTQGFDNVFSDQEQEVDSTLLCLLLCISKIVIYNSFGAIDTHIIQRFCAIASILPQKLQQSPYLILLQRDFYLKLTNNGETMTSSQYLQYFFKNYKNLSSIQIFSALFNDNIQKLQKINCFTLPAPQDKLEYNKKVSILKENIMKYVSNQLISNSSLQFLNSSTLITLIQTFIDEFYSKKQIKNIYELANLHHTQSIRKATVLYKSQLNQIINQSILIQLPLPSNLLQFKFKSVAKQCLQSISQQIFLTNVQQINNKIYSKLLIQNNKKIRQFVQSKTCIDAQKQQQISALQLHIQNVKSCLSFYPFLSQSHILSIQLKLTKKLYDNLKIQYTKVCKVLQIGKKQLLNVQNNKKEQNQNLANQLSGKNKYISELQIQIQQLKRYIKQQKQQQQQNLCTSKSMNIHESNELKIKPNHQNNNKDQLKKVITEIQKSMMSNIIPSQTTTDRKINKQNKQNSCLMESINKILHLIEKEGRQNRDLQKRRNEEIRTYQSMNSSLRARIFQLMEGGNCSDAILKKYEQSCKIFNQKQKIMMSRLNQSCQMVVSLQNERDSLKKMNNSLNSQIQIVKLSLNDKKKSGQFIQQFLSSKQKVLEQTYTQMQRQVNKYKVQLQKTRSKYDENQLKYNETISSLVIQNQKLKLANNELSTKINSNESNLRKSFKNTIQDYQTKINKLSDQLKCRQTSLSDATQSYMNTVTLLQQTLNNKNNQIYDLNLKISELSNQIKKSTQKIQETIMQCKQKQKQIRQLQLLKEQLQSKIKRQQMLSSNKIRNIEQKYEKIQLQMRQKQTTFQLMLTQISKHKQINYPQDPNSENIVKSSKKMSKMKKIDSIQATVLKQLSQIGNIGRNRASSIHSATRIKHQNSAKQYENKMFLTDKKQNYALRSSDKQPIANLLDKFNICTNSANSAIKSFQTIRK